MSSLSKEICDYCNSAVIICEDTYNNFLTYDCYQCNCYIRKRKQDNVIHSGDFYQGDFYKQQILPEFSSSVHINPIRMFVELKGNIIYSSKVFEGTLNPSSAKILFLKYVRLASIS